MTIIPNKFKVKLYSSNEARPLIELKFPNLSVFVLMVTKSLLFTWNFTMTHVYIFMTKLKRFAFRFAKDLHSEPSIQIHSTGFSEC